MPLSAVPPSPPTPTSMLAPTPASPYGVPMSPPQAIPTATSSRDDSIARQVEWYLSRHNLPTDTFLKEHMDSELWVSLDLILTFPRMKAMGVKDAARVAALLHARAPDIEVDAARGRIRPAWALRSNLVLRDVDPSATESDIATLLRIPYSSNPPSPPTSGSEAPHFAGLMSILQVAESTWIAIFDSPTGAADALPEVEGQSVRGRSVSTSVYVEGLELHASPYIPTVYQALPNPYAVSASVPSMVVPPSSPSHDAVAFPHDGSLYPYAYMPYATVSPSPANGSGHTPPSGQVFNPPHRLPSPVPSSVASSHRRSSQTDRANGSGSHQNRVSGNRINGHRRPNYINNRPSHFSQNTSNASNDQPRSPTHTQNGRRPRRTTRRPSTRQQSPSPHHDGQSSDSGQQQQSGTPPLSQSPCPPAEPVPDVTTMHFPPLSSSGVSASGSLSSVTPTNSDMPLSPGDTNDTNSVKSSSVPSPSPRSGVLSKNSKETKEVNVGTTIGSSTPKSYAAILRSKPAVQRSPKPTPSSDEWASTSPNGSSSENGTVLSPSDGDGSAQHVVVTKARRPPRSPGVWAFKPASVVNAASSVLGCNGSVGSTSSTPRDSTNNISNGKASVQAPSYAETIVDSSMTGCNATNGNEKGEVNFAGKSGWTLSTNGSNGSAHRGDKKKAVSQGHTGTIVSSNVDPEATSTVTKVAAR